MRKKPLLRLLHVKRFHTYPYVAIYIQRSISIRGNEYASWFDVDRFYDVCQLYAARHGVEHALQHGVAGAEKVIVGTC